MPAKSILMKKRFPNQVTAIGAVSVLLTVVLSLPQSALASERVTPVSLYATYSDYADRLQQRADGVDRALAEASVSDALSAAGLAVPSVSVPEPADVPEAPLGLQPALGRLVAAVEVAEVLRDRAIHAPPKEIERLINQAMKLQTLATEGSRVPATSIRGETLRGEAANAVDVGMLGSGADLLVSTIRSVLPALQRHASQLSAPLDAVVGYDVLDLSPRLCVGGIGSNEYATDYEITIDLGGDDTYRTAAGGANPLFGGAAVAVSLDLRGNDRYLPEVAMGGSRDAFWGSGYYGIGVLVDVMGRDIYRAEITKRQTTTPSPTGVSDTIVCALGCSNAGAGVAIDVSGKDVYSVTYEAPRDELVSMGGFGANGVGIAVDGVGSAVSDDVYEVRLAPSAEEGEGGYLWFAGGQARGLGEGIVGGFGLFRDSGGSDVLSMTAATEGEGQLGVPQVQAGGFGAAGGTGIATLGPGDTVWDLSARRASELGSKAYEFGAFELGSQPAVAGLGFGLLGGLGILSDAGGDDRYEMRAESRTEVRPGSPDCACSVSVKTNAPGASLMGQGAAATEGTAALLDDGGDDRYVADVDVSAVLEVDGSRAGEPEGQGFASAQSDLVVGITTLYVQGAGDVASAGLLTDTEGDDQYVADHDLEAGSFVVNVPPGAEKHVSAKAHLYYHYGAAQGSSTFSSYALLGALVDEGGTDSYSATWDSAVDARPAGRAEVTQDGDAVYSQAVSPRSALLIDSDGGMADTFVARPDDPPMEGTRGQGIWRNALTVGVNN